ncbi:hypothetical protein K440DRAFT_642723 [Wilcoxina mikolae CBS 423.85]|nr:hypothetical protein K440DRAFT_642723 [Wilcoxina mikolae CBS 423.85]
MLKVWLAALAPLLKEHPNHLKFIKSVTDFILIAGYHTYIKTTHRYFQDELHGISRNINFFLPYRYNQSISKISKIHSQFHYIECIKEMDSTDNSDTEVSEAIHKNHIKDRYRASNKSRDSILRYMIEAASLSAKAYTYRKLLMGDSHSYDKPILSLNLRINGVMKKRNTIPSLAFPNNIIMSEFIQSPTSYFAAFRMNLNASPDLRASGFRKSWILHQQIRIANGITVTIQQHNNLDVIIVQKARCVEKWRRHGNRFHHILIQEDRAPRNNSSVRQQGYRPAKLLYAFRFSDPINTTKANANGRVVWCSVHYDLLLVEELEYLSSAIPNVNHRMIICRDVLQQSRQIINVSSVVIPIHLVPSGSDDNQYFINQYTSLEIYNMIY